MRTQARYSRLAGLLAFMSFLGVVLSACNTLEGAGEDIENAGEEIQEEAD